MKKNPGRKDRRWTHHKNQSHYSEKKMAINERIQLWANNWRTKRKIPEGFRKSAAKTKEFMEIMEG